MVVACLPVLLLAGCGGSSSPSRSAAAGATPAGVAHTEGAGTDVSAAQGSAPAATGGTPESSAVRSLIALGKPIYCAAPHGDEVALTFDDGPGPYTSLALRKLRKHRVPSTFFIVGRNIARFSPTLLPAESRLEAVGDHTFTHPFLPALSATAVADELGRTQRLIAQTTGSPVALFRPPYGGRTAAIDAEVKRLGMLEVIWSVDSRDSEGANYAQIAANVDSGMRPGAIILMHENRGQTIRAMLQIFPALARKHLQPVTLPELLAADPPSLSQLRAGGRGCGGVSVSRLSG
jgi:peptidoglycan/xylan/chitin deacetylase (PgdA/CDA1 family)